MFKGDRVTQTFMVQLWQSKYYFGRLANKRLALAKATQNEQQKQALSSCLHLELNKLSADSPVHQSLFIAIVGSNITLSTVTLCLQGRTFYCELGVFPAWLCCLLTSPSLFTVSGALCGIMVHSLQ